MADQKHRFLPSIRYMKIEEFRRYALSMLIFFLFVPFAYWVVYPLIALERIDDSANFSETVVDKGGSKAVATAIALIDREVNRNGWVANDPWFAATTLLDNMPNYQEGILYALGRFAIEMSDHIGRARGTSQIDEQLNDAVGRLKLSGRMWYYDSDVSLISLQTTSETQYNKARESLLLYNQRLANGQAVFEHRADNLLATLDRIAADLGSASALTEKTLNEASWFLFEDQADDVFFANKGRIYGYLMLMKGFGVDFKSVIEDRQLETVWNRLLVSLEDAIHIRPWIVMNGPVDGVILPNHLAVQGFYLLRSRAQLKEVINILLK